ncbi:universal stress protein [Dongia soli]|uniref:Universal stress protein n=1 Tax=Dongia soli TaxID=600628 RepID=A0ABU5E781_9PROT|nr:universal stress protein [Dongia soli]MDY0882167.1 universal stress protein [Dongia soli]
MADETENGGKSAAEAALGRIFLVVIDDSPEMKTALRYACRRAAKSGGRVAMVHVSEPTGFREWVGVSQLMQDEARQQAEAVMQKMAAEVSKLSGKMPVLYFREGDRREEVMKLIDEELTISILVLGAATGPKGPGPLVTALSGKFVGKLRVPLTIVPGHLTQEDIEHIA